MTKKILLFGMNGQIGWALQRTLAYHGRVLAFDRISCDVGSEAQLRGKIQEVQPDVIVNAAAYTAVEQAETHEEECALINAFAPQIMAEEACKIGAVFVHYSTDYVFNGEKGSAYHEYDEANPINAYGRTKLNGDKAIIATNGQNIILRVGWIYSLIGHNFPRTILRLASTRDELEVVNDQFGVPTSADLVAGVTAKIIDQYFIEKCTANGDSEKFSGIYHLAPSGSASWYDFALELVRQTQLQNPGLKLAKNLLPVPSAGYPSTAKRPKYSVLKTEKLVRAFSFSLPEWQFDVARFVREWSALK